MYIDNARKKNGLSPRSGPFLTISGENIIKTLFYLPVPCPAPKMKKVESFISRKMRFLSHFLFYLILMAACRPVQVSRKNIFFSRKKCVGG